MAGNVLRDSSLPTVKQYGIFSCKVLAILCCLCKSKDAVSRARMGGLLGFCIAVLLPLLSFLGYP